MELCALPVATGSFPFNSLFNQLHIHYHFKPSVAHLTLVTWIYNPHYPLPSMKAATPQQQNMDKVESKESLY